MTGISDPAADTLADWLRFLGTSDCSCPYEWRSLGRLYGHGWVRMTTAPTCPHHGGAT